MKKISKIKAIVLFTVFIDIVGIGVIIPTLPFYVQSFGVSDAVVTILFTIYALLSFISAPFLGALSDKYGRRPVLILSIASSAIGWLVFAGAKSVFALFLGRIIDGLAAGNISSAQSALADIAKDEKERAVNMGYIGAMFGIGFVIGPVLGGFLGTLGHTAPFWFVGILATVNTVLAYLFLPETHKTEKRSIGKVSANPIKPVIDGFKNKDMRMLFGIFFLFGTAIAMQQSVFSLYMYRVFAMSPKTIGLVMAFIGIILLINQVFLFKKVWVKYSSRKLARMMLIVFSLGIFITATPVLLFFYVGLIFTTIGQGNLRSVFMNMIASYNREKTGEYIGIATSIMSLSMVAGPLIATVAYPLNTHAPFILAGICMLACFPLIRKISAIHSSHNTANSS